MAKRKNSKPSAKETSDKTSSWIITTNNERPIDEVASELKKAGFEIRDVLKEIGSITGSGASNAAAKARQIKGVADVAADFPIDLGDPNSDQTW